MSTYFQAPQQPHGAYQPLDQTTFAPGVAAGQQPVAGQPYAGQPYAGQPYAGQPYAGQPYAGQQYAGQPVVVAVPMAGGVYGHVEPSSVGIGIKIMMLSVWSVIVLLTIIYSSVMWDDDSGSATFFIVYMIVILAVTILAVVIKWPTATTLSPTCVILSTRCTSFSLSYERITSVELLPSVCCWCGAACTAPKGSFTSLTNGVFFRSPDCGQSIAFSPQDFPRFVDALRRTPLANRIIQM